MADGPAVDGVVPLVDGPLAVVAAEALRVEGPARLLGPHHVAADGVAALGATLQERLRLKANFLSFEVNLKCGPAILFRQT